MHFSQCHDTILHFCMAKHDVPCKKICKRLLDQIRIYIRLVPNIEVNDYIFYGEATDMLYNDIL